MLDLRADLALGFFGFDVLQRRAGFRPQVSVGIEQAWNCVLRGDCAPAVGFPFAGECEVQAEIGVRMSLCIGRDFGEPGAGNNDAGGRSRMFVECIEAGCVLGVGDGEVVGVDDQQLRVCGIAEAFSDRLCLSCKRQIVSKSTTGMIRGWFCA